MDIVISLIWVCRETFSQQFGHQNGYHSFKGTSCTSSKVSYSLSVRHKRSQKVRARVKWNLLGTRGVAQLIWAWVFSPMITNSSPFKTIGGYLTVRLQGAKGISWGVHKLTGLDTHDYPQKKKKRKKSEMFLGMYINFYRKWLRCYPMNKIFKVLNI